MINIVLVDDYSIVRSGLRKLLEQLENIKVLTDCANGEEVMNFVKLNEGVDLVISVPIASLIRYAIKRRLIS